MITAKLAYLAAGLAALATAAQAQESMTVRGEATFGVDYERGKIAGESFSLPMATLGGKLDIEANNGLGLQLDGNFSGAPLSWFNPDLGVDGDVRDLSAMAHFTFGPRSDLRFGAFAGIEQLQLGVDDIDLSDFLDTARLFDASAAANFWTAGIEVQFALDAANVIEARAGYIDPFSFTIEGSDGFTDESLTESDSDNIVWGWHTGLGYETALTSNISLRADANYMRYIVEDEGHVNLISAMLGAKYAFDNVPLSLNAAAGFGHLWSGGDSDTEFLAKLGMTWEFGTPSDGVNGRFFHSVTALGTLN